MHTHTLTHGYVSCSETRPFQVQGQKQLRSRKDKKDLWSKGGSVLDLEDLPDRSDTQPMQKLQGRKGCLT